MFLAAPTYQGLFYGSLVVAVIAVLVTLGQHETRVRLRGNVPAAQVRGGRARVRAIALRWLAPVLVLGGFAAAYGLHTRSHAVWRVTDGAGGPAVAERVYLGNPATAYPSADKPSDGFSTLDSYLINESSADVRVETVQYGGFGFGGGLPPEIVPPGAALTVYQIDDIGPDHPPPHEITATGFNAQIGMDSRRWLTWGPPAGDRYTR